MQPSNWTEHDHPTPEQERETWAREECVRRDIDPDEIVADGGVEAWMVVAKEPRPDARLATITKAICKSAKFESGHGTCAFLCMSGLGDVRKSGCAYHQQIHGDMATQVVDALDQASAS